MKPFLSWKEQVILMATLLWMGGLSAGDLISDMKGGVSPPHMLWEGALFLASVLGIAILLRAYFFQRKLSNFWKNRTHRSESEAQQWKKTALSASRGISEGIDRQFREWKLSPSEKEIALLLIKGFSTREIATLRLTNEKTVRAQSVSIYSKAGLKGRSELAAFFLEDLLGPSLSP